LRKSTFVLLALAALAGGCSRSASPPETKASSPAPLCPPAGVEAAIDVFDAAEQRRSEVLQRVETYSRDEPADYRRRLDADITAIREASQSVESIAVPSCLRHTRELLILALMRTNEALERNAPDADPIEYRRARDAADAVLAQYRSELALQKKNVQ
jgi:hypothetical protein